MVDTVSWSGNFSAVVTSTTLKCAEKQGILSVRIIFHSSGEHSCCIRLLLSKMATVVKRTLNDFWLQFGLDIWLISPNIILSDIMICGVH
jgi:hypothetical protein